MTITVAEINIFPVKSLAGIKVDKAVVTPYGLEGDREWMLVNDKNHFVTQRKNAQMALVSASWKGGNLYLSTPGLEPILVPKPSPATPIENVSVWQDTCKAQAADNKTNAWITSACQSEQPLRLMHFYKPNNRAKNTARFGNNSTYFADAAPYLIANNESLKALNTKLLATGEANVTMDRFRANIVLDGLPAFTEHTTTSITQTTEGIGFTLIDHCKRCVIITIDPTTGTRHPKQSPFTALSSINAMPDNAKAPAFGVNCILNNGEGLTLNLGDVITAEPS